MPSPQQPPLQAISLERLPSFQGYFALPLHPFVPLMPVQASLVFRADSGTIVPLREELFSSAYLACLTDAAGNFHGWLEFVCRSPYTVDTELAYRNPANSQVDQELQRRLKFDQEMNAPSVFALPQAQVPALFVDPANRVVTTLQGKSSAPWELCTDDAILTRAGLPKYSTADYQYLYCPADSEASRRFVSVSVAAPSGKFTIALEDVDPKAKEWLLLTIGGTVSLRRFAQLSFAAYSDLISGNKPPKLAHGKHELDIITNQTSDSEGNAISTGRLLCSHTGIAGKMCEALHLKLQAWADAMAAVRRALTLSQRPLLTLTEADFRVLFPRIGPNLPALWNSSILLRPPADTIELEVDADHRYFIPNAVSPSIYTAPAASSTFRGTASMRLRTMTADPDGRVRFEGTLSTQERLKAGNLDLVLLKLNIAGVPLTLATHLEADKALARSEFRVRSMPVALDDAAKARLAGSEGAWVEGISFEILPLLSSPSDLFSVAILGIRCLLVNADFPLPVALDEIMSLANESSADQGKLVDKIARLFAADPRWAKALGPQRLVDDNLAPAVALDFVPPSLWFEILALLIQMIPRASPESFCGDFGQAAPGRIEGVFDGPLREARRLVACTRSLLVVDWRTNREVGTAIRDVLKEVSGAA